MSSPIRNPEAWDRLVIQGPGGKVTLHAPRITARGRLRVDVAPDQVVTHLGYEPREVQVEARVWDAEQWPEIESLLELWRPAGDDPKPAACTAIHPQLELLGLERVYIWTVDLQPYDPREGYRLRLTLREWWPEKIEQPKPPEAVAGGGGGGGLIGEGTQLVFGGDQ